MLNSFKEYQRILLLGGKSDIGLGIVVKIPKSSDASLILMGRNISSFNFQSEVATHNISLVNQDFLNIDQSMKTIDRLFEESDIDLCIVSYAILGNPEFQLDESHFTSILDTNFTSQVHLLSHVAKRMCLQKHGQILLISSVAGLRPQKYNFVYGASKAGVDFIAQGLQKICEPQNVNITILRPGFVRTKLSKDARSAPFETSVEAVARIAVEALNSKRLIAYAPPILAPVMFLIKIIPNWLMARLETLRS